MSLFARLFLDEAVEHPGEFHNWDDDRFKEEIARAKEAENDHAVMRLGVARRAHEYGVDPHQQVAAWERWGIRHPDDWTHHERTVGREARAREGTLGTKQFAPLPGAPAHERKPLWNVLTDLSGGKKSVDKRPKLGRGKAPHSAPPYGGYRGPVGFRTRDAENEG